MIPDPTRAPTMSEPFTRSHVHTVPRTALNQHDSRENNKPEHTTRTGLAHNRRGTRREVWLLMRQLRKAPLTKPQQHPRHRTSRRQGFLLHTCHPRRREQPTTQPSNASRKRPHLGLAGNRTTSQHDTHKPSNRAANQKPRPAQHRTKRWFGSVLTPTSNCGDVS